MCFTLGLLFVLAAGWVLDMVMPPGAAKSIIEWVIIGVALTLFGGIAVAAKHR